MVTQSREYLGRINMRMKKDGTVKMTRNQE
jgi:hypothetical protein